MMHKIYSMPLKGVLALTIMIFLSSQIYALDFTLSDQGSGVKTTSNGTSLSSGSLSVEIWDSASGGTIIYNETFPNAIQDGEWNVILGANSSLPLSLRYARLYYKDYRINSEDANFTNSTGQQVSRQPFYAPLGDINGSRIEENSIQGDKINSGATIELEQVI